MANINVTYEQLDQAAARLRAGQEELDHTLMKLRAMVTELVSHGFTTTRASGAFDQASEEFTMGARQTLTGLQGMANFLSGASQTLRNTDEELARQIQSR